RLRVLGPRLDAADRRYEIESCDDESVVWNVGAEIERSWAGGRFHCDFLFRQIHVCVVDPIRADRLAEVREIGASRHVERDRTAIAVRNDVRLGACSESES